MDQIMQALMAQYMQPTQVEVDEMGMGRGMQDGGSVQHQVDPTKQEWHPAENLRTVAEIIEGWKTLKNG